MSTGSLAVLISQQPNTFTGLMTIGKIFFIVDLILMVVFSTAISFRFLTDPDKPTRLRRSLHKPQEALFFGSFWVSVALVLMCIQQYGVPSCGPWLVSAMRVLFWIYVACALLVAVFQYSTLFVREQISISSAMPAWVFPVYPMLVIGPLASLMIPDQSPESALQLFIGGVTLQGLGWLVAMLMYSVYFVRLMSGQLPPPPSRPGMFVGVGPAGYTATGLVGLASQASIAIPAGFLGLDGFNTAATLQVIGTFSGIFVWALAFWFFALALVAVLQGVRKMTFTLNWWGFIFPNAGMIVALIQIANALNSPAMKWIASAMTIVLVIMWLFTAGAHIRAVWNRQILWEGKDEDAGQDSSDDETVEGEHDD